MPPSSGSKVEGCYIKTSRSSGTITSTSGQKAKRASESFFDAIAGGLSLNVNYVSPVSKGKKILVIEVWKNNIFRRSKIFEGVYIQVDVTNFYSLKSKKFTGYNTLIESIDNFKQTGSTTAMMKAVNAYFRFREIKIKFRYKNPI